jgi:hypothetical protein
VIQQTLRGLRGLCGGRPGLPRATFHIREVSRQTAPGENKRENAGRDHEASVCSHAAGFGRATPIVAARAKK